MDCASDLLAEDELIVTICNELSIFTKSVKAVRYEHFKRCNGFIILEVKVPIEGGDFPDQWVRDFRHKHSF